MCPYYINYSIESIVVAVQSLNHIQHFATPWMGACLASILSPSPGACSNSCPLSRWCHPATSSSVIPFSSCPQSLPASESFPMSQLLRWPKYWSFSFSIIPSKEIPGLISFRMDWLDLFAVQGTLRSLLQHHSSKASILRHSAFFTVQLLHPYITTGKSIALARLTFFVKVIMSLLFNMLYRLVITFLPRSKCLLISRLAVTICNDFGAQKIKVCHCFHCFPIYLLWNDGATCDDIHFLNVEL